MCRHLPQALATLSRRTPPPTAHPPQDIDCKQRCPEGHTHTPQHHTVIHTQIQQQLRRRRAAAANLAAAPAAALLSASAGGIAAPPLVAGGGGGGAPRTEATVEDGDEAGRGILRWMLLPSCDTSRWRCRPAPTSLSAPRVPEDGRSHKRDEAR